jgi:hypothetical protein
MKKLLFTFVSFSLIAFALTAEEKEKSIKVDTSETLKKDSESKKLELDKDSTFKSDGKKKLELNKDTFKSDSKKLEFDTSNTFSKGSSGKSSISFDTDSTFSSSGSKSASAGTTAQNIKERLSKNPEIGKLLQAKAAEMEELTKRAQATKEPNTIKACTEFTASLKTMADFHAGKEVPDEKLLKAYKDCQDVGKEISQLKQRVVTAGRNSPAARKIRTFRRSAASDFSQAQMAARQGYKAKAEYYNTRAKLQTQAAATYAQDPQAEKTCNEGIQAAWKKYQMNDAQESAARFRRRAKDAGKRGDKKDADYYEKVALLKERLHDAYKNNNQDSVKSIQKEYAKLRSER